MADFQCIAAKQIINSKPRAARVQLLQIRELIFQVASSLDGVGRIEETLKWGEVSYLTPDTKSGSTIRIDWKEKYPDECIIYFNCKTTLIADFREQFRDELKFLGNRGIRTDLSMPLPIEELSECIAMALTYHHRHRSESS